MFVSVHLSVFGLHTHGIQFHHLMANREKVEAVTDFIFLASKMTVDCDSSHEIKRHLLLGRKAMTNLDSILKSRDITLLTKVHWQKRYGFSNSYLCIKVWKFFKKLKLELPYYPTIPTPGHIPEENWFKKINALQCSCVCMLSHVWLFATLWTTACQASLSMGFSRQEYWNGLPFPSPGTLLDPGIKQGSPATPALADGFFYHWAIWDSIIHNSQDKEES